jgi:hypothetical protein
MNQQINLYNPLLEPRREWMTFNVAAGTALALLLLVVLGSVAANWRYNVLLAREQASAQRLTQAKDEMTRLANQLGSRQKDPQLLAELDRAQMELRARDEVIGILQGGSLGNTSGYSEYLRAFARQAIDGVWLTGFSIAGAGHDVVIQGRTVRAELVPDYLQRLNRESVLKGSTFAEMRMYQPPRQVDPEKKPAQPDFLEFRIATSADPAGKKEGQR